MSDTPMAHAAADALAELDQALAELRRAAAGSTTLDRLGTVRRLALEVVDRCDRATLLTTLDLLADDADDDFARFMAGDDERHLVEFA